MRSTADFGSVGERSSVLLCRWRRPCVAMNREYLPGIKWPEPPIVTPGENGSPPSDAIVLFDGKDLSAWENGDTWKVDRRRGDRGPRRHHTKQSFGDCQLHIEWSAPDPPRRPAARTAATAASSCRTATSCRCSIRTTTRPISTARPARSTSRRRRWSTRCGRRASGTSTTSSGPRRGSTTTARSSRPPTSRCCTTAC